MKHLGQRYVQYVNRTYGRSGTLWGGRFRSCLVEAESYLLRCHRYIELNPVRAGLVSHPGAYRWSSYPVNADGAPHGLLTPHACYVALGQTDSERQFCYRALFREALEPSGLAALRSATNGGYCVGQASFKEAIAGMLKRRVERGQPGRPQKPITGDV